MSITGDISTPLNSGNSFLIGLKSGSVTLYRKLPIILTKLLWVLIIPKLINQLIIA